MKPIDSLLGPGSDKMERLLEEIIVTVKYNHKIAFVSLKPKIIGNLN